MLKYSVRRYIQSICCLKHARFTLIDIEQPKISGTSNIAVDTLATLSNNQASWILTCEDNVDVNINPDCTHTSGSYFEVGITHVNCTCTDNAGNTAVASFQVTVIGKSAKYIISII